MIMYLHIVIITVCGGSKSSKSEHLIKTGSGSRQPMPILPEKLDDKLRFSSVGGLDGHVQCLREMILLPMMYPEVFKQFHVQPPRGVLFHGPPGKYIHHSTLHYSTLLYNKKCFWQFV